MKNKLQVAIITPKSNTLNNWQYQIIEDLKHLDFIELNLVFVVKPTLPIDCKPSLFWKLFKKIDARLFKPNPNAFSRKNTASLLEKMPVKELKDFDLSNYTTDVIINFTNYNPESSFVNTAKHGVWFLNHSDSTENNKLPYAIWEVINKHPQSGAQLLRQNNSNIELIDSTFSCTDKLSYTRSINALFWQSKDLLKYNLSLLSKNVATFEKKVLSQNTTNNHFKLENIVDSPSNLTILKHTLKTTFNKTKQLITSKFYFSQWTMIFSNIQEKDDASIFNLKDYKRIISPKDRFWADPFLIKENGKYYLFIEELLYANGLGHLSVCEIDKNGNITKPEIILKKDYHLSYPFVFKENDTYYMIPETSGNKDIQLYKCIEFPLKWELEKVIMTDIVAVDTTLFKKDNLYWMFTNVKEGKGTSKNVELCLYYSKDLHSNNWTPHPLNPVVKDVRKSRPAGKIFEKDGKIYRPTQNCSNYYGYGMNICEILTLNEHEYEERISRTINPDWAKDTFSTHTFNAVDDLYISDIKVKRSRFF